MSSGLNGAFTIYDPGYPCSIPDVSTPALAAAVGLENHIRADSLETGAFIAASGAVVISKTGLPDRVRFFGSDLVGTDGTLFTHNHPADSSFSRPDIVAAILSDLQELRAVGPTLRHRLLAPQGWPRVAALDAAIAQCVPGAQQRVARMVAAGDVAARFQQQEVVHQLWSMVAKKLGMDYQREKS